MSFLFLVPSSMLSTVSALGAQNIGAEVVRLGGQYLRGSHGEAPEQYSKLAEYAEAHKLEICGFSREVTMIDYGITHDVDKFVTEIAIPVM